MRRLRGRTLIVGTAAVLALALAACGGSNTDSASPTGQANAGGLEKTTITIGALPIPDSAGIHIAKAKGYFAQEGLDVKIQPLQSSALAVPGLLGGSLDMILGNYFAILNVQAKKGGEFRFLADAFEAKPDIFLLVVPKDSPIKEVKQLKGATIAVPAVNSIGELATGYVLRTAGLDRQKDVTFKPMAFPDMPANLASGNVDAAWITEPFATAVQKANGARKIADTMTGAMADFPIAGWTVTKKWAEANPKTAAAFQRAYIKGQQIAASDRKEVEKALLSYTEISAADASVIGMGAFPTTLNGTRIQRVADLMQEFGYLQESLDVTPLLVPLPQ
ncbi:ABC transporter substrate-binding protein [Sphaerisporangium sp. TRM90804]|uniref:ABC transporter substrate-binding protein n=1 Tax=Sphaerisporangium sp. TRM90804 TaxID=3031113 RepID=UPI00244C6AA0|nr:ABC transporter substrate-binding protein [Sphaerisporangium sp. TRM90804]MDH2430086.1 ABC transporter substrate-binding protein [Sphaerisporangium sp. TRM90804]